jgi:hypothetical protein
MTVPVPPLLPMLIGRNGRAFWAACVLKFTRLFASYQFLGEDHE